MPDRVSAVEAPFIARMSGSFCASAEIAVLDREREEVLGFLRGLRGDTGREHHRAAIADDDGSVCLFGNLAGLDGERPAVDFDLYSMTHLGDRPRAPGVFASEDQSMIVRPAVTGGFRACR